MSERIPTEPGPAGNDENGAPCTPPLPSPEFDQAADAPMLARGSAESNPPESVIVPTAAATSAGESCLDGALIPDATSYGERLAASNRIADILAERGIELVKMGARGIEAAYRCPLCSGSPDEATLHVHLTRNVFTCATCNRWGNVVDFVMAIENLPSEAEALGWLARHAGLPEIPPAQVIHFLGQGDPSPETVLGVTSPLSLGRFSRARCLGREFLRANGVEVASSMKPPTIRFTYLDSTRHEISARFLNHLGDEPADDMMRNKKGTKPVPYGLWKLDTALRTGYVFLVSGETDALTLWAYDLPALGLPDTWDDQWLRYFEGLETVYLVVLPGLRGDELAAKLAATSLRDRLRIIRVPADLGSLSQLHRERPYDFVQGIDDLRREATSPEEEVRAAKRRAALAAWPKCEALAKSPDILAEFATSVEAIGLAGEASLAQLVYLAVVSRVLDRPVSLAVKGPSSSGKSYLVQKVLDHFPSTAWFGRTALSDKAIAYTEESLVHRFLVIFEMAGVASDTASYLIRSLLSENCIDYETVVDSPKGLVSLHIHKDGPSGLIVTTTEAALHAENETRLLSITIADTAEQTGLVTGAIAEAAQNPGKAKKKIDLERWIALQTWLEGAEAQVVIPYAVRLEKEIPKVAVRLRRDIKTLFSLIDSHAILHQCSRRRDEDGRIIAELQDYAAVYSLVSELFAEGLEASVPAHIRETIKVIRQLDGFPDGTPVTLEKLTDSLRLDRSSVRRRIKVGINLGLLRNVAPLKKPYEVLVTERAIAEAGEVLPHPTKLAGAKARETPGDDPLPSVIYPASSQNAHSEQ